MEPPTLTRRSTPLIGITTYVEHARWNAWEMPAALAPHAYVAAVSAAGGRPLLLPPTESGAVETVAALDGLILSGGADLDPGLYGAPAHPQTQGVRPERDAGELALLAAALEGAVPVLGVCRGLELINVALGGDLVQHLPDLLGVDEHRGAPGQFVEHPIHLRAGSALADRLAGLAPVPSYHHQGVGRLADPLEPFAWAPDGTLEAFQHRRLPFVVGVLWHPEAGEDPRLFEALVDAARARGDAHAHPTHQEEATRGS